MSLINHAKDVVQGKANLGDHRSSEWPKIRKQHLIKQPNCMACGNTKALEVHHIQPFNEHPELELDLNNLITLCESKKNGVNCHLLFGHLGNYRSINPNVIQDAQVWNTKITTR